jgi:hypothetical protein
VRFVRTFSVSVVAPIVLEGTSKVVIQFTFVPVVVNVRLFTVEKRLPLLVLS